MKANYTEAKKAIDAMLEKFDGTLFWDYLDVHLTDQFGRLKDTKYAPTDCFGYPAETIKEFLYNSSEDYESLMFSAGATRTVIWDTDWCDYVIKIGSTREDEKFNVKEEQVYVDAKLKGAADAFAWMTCIYEPGYEIRPGVVLDRGIYAMEFVDCDDLLISSITSTAMWEDYCDDWGIDPMNSEAYDKFLDEYGEEMAYNDELVLDYAIQREWSEDLGEKVMDVIMDNEIKDIHNANVGFKDGKFVICDYAGWR